MNKGCRPDPKTMPVTKEYAENHERIFGGKSRAKPGRYVFDPVTKEMVLYNGESNRDSALNSGVMSGRHYENTAATDGTDIGSRTKHKDYMKQNGMAHMSDYKPDYGDRVKASQERKEEKSIRGSAERAFYKYYKP